jgi:hypothetical protein
MADWLTANNIAGCVLISYKRSTKIGHNRATRRASFGMGNGSDWFGAGQSSDFHMYRPYWKGSEVVTASYVST